MSEQNYRERSFETRRLARQKIIDLREARKAQRATLFAQKTPDDADSAVELNVTAGGPDMKPAHVRGPEIASDFAGSIEDTNAVSESSFPGSGEFESELDSLDSLAAKSAMREEPESDGLVQPKGDQVVAADKPLQSCTRPIFDESADSLTKLPGAAEGLIWMLEQCGIASLSDLAVADAAVLSRRLGIVGNIANVGRWVEFAQMHRDGSSHAAHEEDGIDG